MTQDGGLTEAGSVAYFSMEIAIDGNLPTYSGGLGVLAGDTLRAAADWGVPLVGVTLLYHNGYVRQQLDAAGNQIDAPSEWQPDDRLTLLPQTAMVSIEGRSVRVRAWRYDVTGVLGDRVPVYLLDTDLPENAPFDRTLTDTLYGGDEHYRLCQEAVLGIGGVAMLRALGYDAVRTYHMNEGHSALLTLALLAEQAAPRGWEAVTDVDLAAVRQRCVFTTHTPVPAGQDQFSLDLARQVLGEGPVAAVHMLACHLEGRLNMTFLALFFSRYTNGVSLRHEEVARSMFPRYPINAITNGVHAATWTGPAMAALFDRHVPEWRRDNLYLRYVLSVPLAEIQAAHDAAKRRLFAEVERRTGKRLDPGVLTLGFGRRMTPYKRPDLLLADSDRLIAIARATGGLQIVYSGKAHPHDEGGKALIRRIYAAAAQLGDTLPIVFLEGYDVPLAGLLCAGVDVWLNTPQKPLEASGTSGMKAALNGVPSLSVLDGWWLEGHLEGVTGWAIGDAAPESDAPRESADLYDKLEQVIAPLYYHQPTEFARIRRAAIAINGAYFNAERMLRQYERSAYGAAARNEAAGQAD